MLLTTLTVLSFITLFLGYKTLKNTKELKELKLKHKITTTFADKLAHQLIQTEKAAKLHKVLSKKAEWKAKQSADSNTQDTQKEEVKHKKTRRSKKRVSKKTS